MCFIPRENINIGYLADGKSGWMSSLYYSEEKNKVKEKSVCSFDNVVYFCKMISGPNNFEGYLHQKKKKYSPFW